MKVKPIVDVYVALYGIKESGSGKNIMAAAASVYVRIQGGRWNLYLMESTCLEVQK